MKKAVCIGINYYGTPSKLNGCINDAHDMRDLLVDQYAYPREQVRMVCDQSGFEQPTRANILAAMAWLVDGMKPGDQCFLSYSGHGSYTRDILRRDESDGRDEVLCAVDGAIVDDVIFDTLIRRVPAGAQLICFFDCCHSGSITDLKYNYICAPGANQNWQKYELMLERGYDAPGNVFMFSGCYDHQVSMDVVMRDAQTNYQGRPCGAFTYCMLSTLRANDYAHVTNQSLLVQLNQCLKQRKFVQISQFSCSKPELFEAEFQP